VDVRDRPASAVESTAYFVVSEALTNVTKHARATAAAVDIVRNGNRLYIEVNDNGIGGADPATGSGLRGLRDRVDALDGELSVSSPPGGPTTLRVELPCAS
jgi:signal transduction histidine kinase